MAETKRSLAELNPKVFDVPVLILASFCFLIWGLQAPVITLKELVFWQHTFSIATGIVNLFRERYYGLGILILLFSVMFPFIKITALLCLWGIRLSEKNRGLFIHWIGVLGKWSMLDVFVVAVTIVISKISMLAKAEPHIGIYIFGLAIFLSMIAAMRMAHLTKTSSLPRKSNIL